MLVKKQKNLIVTVLVVTMLLAIGCAAFGGAETKAPQPETQLPTQEAPSLNPTKIPQEPAQTPAATLPSDSMNPGVDFNGIRFNYDPALCQGVTTETIAENPPSDATPPWEVTPKYDKITLTGYILKSTFHTPALIVYPVKRYSEMDEDVKGRMKNLKDMVDNKPNGPFKSLPFLPFWNAGPVITSNFSYIEFKNGSGIRFLTEFAQSFAPVNNEDLFYTFQGLTTDGKYYVSLILPISHPTLIPNGNISSEEYNKLAEDYHGYIDKIQKSLESQPPSSFVPGLQILDELVQSIQIDK